MKKWMNQPHYHKHGWAKYDEAQAEIDNLESRLANALSGKTQQAEIDELVDMLEKLQGVAKGHRCFIIAKQVEWLIAKHRKGNNINEI